VTAAEHDRLLGVAVGLAAELGVDVWMWPDSRRVSRKGWPDLTFAGPGGVMLREVKTGSAKPTWEQKHVGYLLIAAGLDWAVWREAHFANGTVRAKITALATYRRVS
jgi:hypothetical protein